MSKVYAQKLGEKSYRVFIDSTGPTPISSWDELVPHAMAQLYSSVNEIKNTFRATDVMVLERPNTGQKIITSSPQLKQEAVTFLSQSSGITPSSASAPASIVLPISNRSDLDKAKAFLNTLRTALQYASKKNSRMLELKVEAVQELIKEVWNED